ncbi:MmgE/PrpD family protein [uncultured Litoreibacter sp.]|uniref:MmgE/PrpD family protein n=1 Tax=uncultured Litoreibacter sp. TaxID=1392394 RepID=UPI00261FBA1B|nr:MmgE/PrpD family protein [uncultured Litoreibacter sp.]
MKDMAPDPSDFLRNFALEKAPPEVIARAKLHLLDLCGIAQGGSRTKLAGIINAHAAEDFAGEMPMLCSDLTASPLGVALAGGMTIDALDGHDGSNPTKGHVGCALLPGMMALAPTDCSGDAFLEALILGYEYGTRLGTTLHATTPDYHTSGAWMAVAVAAVGARLQGLNDVQTAHAMGIAEYHGPRSQMMRVIDTPTMLKDGSGWGAMAGVSAVRLAAKGFTGAPALTLDGPVWQDLGTRWYMLEQYIKPYPTCRWSHGPVEAALGLQRAHGFSAADVAKIEVETFHNACRLACNDPKTTEEAQYSTSHPVAIALSRGGIGPFDLDEDALNDPEIRRLSLAMTMSEHADAERVYPGKRIARVRISLISGDVHQSEWQEPKWESTAPPTAGELREKYDSIAVPVAGVDRAGRIADAIEALPNAGIAPLLEGLSGAP